MVKTNMTIEMAAACVKACNNAADPDLYDLPIYLFTHFVESFGWNCFESEEDCERMTLFARLCGFEVSTHSIPKGESFDESEDSQA